MLGARETPGSRARQGLRIWQPQPGLVRSEPHGHLSAELADELIAQLEQALTSAPIHHIFHNWWGMTGYDAAARTKLTQWSLERRSRLASVHILLQVNSRLLAMAIAASNLILGGLLQIHERPMSFEAALAEVRGGSEPPRSGVRPKMR